MSAANPRSLLLVFFVLAARHQALAQGTPTRTVADSCFATSEFQLRDVFLNTDTTGNLAKLGRALRVKIDSGVDDGGRFERRTFYYPDLEMAVVRGAVDRFTTRARNLSTPSGLRPGLDVQSVRRVLLKRGITFKLGADIVDIRGCESFSDAYVTLIFDGTRHVRILEIFAARP
jgi:hypothetical protein